MPNTRRSTTEGRISLRTDRLSLLAVTRNELAAAARAPSTLPIIIGLQPPQNDDSKYYSGRAAIYNAKSRLMAFCPDDWLLCTSWQISLNGIAIGEIGFKGPPDGGEVEIGYGLREAYRGCGYMTEAVNALCRFIFTADSRVMSVVALTKWRNTASHRVLLRCRFTRDGYRGVHYLWRLGKSKC